MRGCRLWGIDLGSRYDRNGSKPTPRARNLTVGFGSTGARRGKTEQFLGGLLQQADSGQMLRTNRSLKTQGYKPVVTIIPRRIS